MSMAFGLSSLGIGKVADYAKQNTVVGKGIFKDGTSSPKLETDPSKAGSASDLMGQITRQQWDDYVARFQPYDKKLIDLATGQADNEAAIQRAREGVAGAYDVANGTMQRNNERLGLSLANDESAAIANRSANSKALAELNVVNNTRLHAEDRDKQILSGSGAVGLRSANPRA